MWLHLITHEVAAGMPELQIVEHSIASDVQTETVILAATLRHSCDMIRMIRCCSPCASSQGHTCLSSTRRAAGYLRRMVQLDYYDTTRTPDNDKVAAFARRWAGLVLTRRNDYVLKFD